MRLDPKGDVIGIATTFNRLNEAMKDVVTIQNQSISGRASMVISNEKWTIKLGD